MKYWIDTEFNGWYGDLISLAVIREDGQSLSIYSEETSPTEWVAQNVIPLLGKDAGAIQVKHWDEARIFLRDFFKGDADPIVIADWPTDIKHFCDLMIVSPGFSMPIPFITFKIVTPIGREVGQFLEHNAWYDAVRLKDYCEKYLDI